MYLILDTNQENYHTANTLSSSLSIAIVFAIEFNKGLTLFPSLFLYLLPIRIVRIHKFHDSFRTIFTTKILSDFFDSNQIV